MRWRRKRIIGSSQTDEQWKPLLTQAGSAADPALRHGAAVALGHRSPQLAAQLVGPLLADQDRETRSAAANVVLQILSSGNGGSSVPRVFFSSSSRTRTNQPVADPAQIAAWHTAMLQHADPSPDLNLAAAIFATGDGKAGLPGLVAALAATNAVPDDSPLGHAQVSAAIGSILPKLSLPEGRPVLDQLAASPFRYALAAAMSKRCQPDVAGYLLDPARFKSAVEPADGSRLAGALETVAGYQYSSYGAENNLGTWSLWTESDSTKAVALALVQSTNAGWRAAAIYSLSLRADAKDNLAIFEKAAADPDSWVRVSAVKAMARNPSDRPALEQCLAPLLADTNVTVAGITAVALLEPEIRQAASLDEALNEFQFEAAFGGRSTASAQISERPLSTLDGKPAFLPSARHWLAATNAAESVAFALLLAQYGEFDGVDRLATQLPTLDTDRDQSLADALLTGIALSSNIKYLPALKQMASARNDPSELRKILSALKGLSGPDARQLRLDINRKIRDAGGSSSDPDF